MGNGYAGQVAGSAEGVPRQAMDVHHAAVGVVVARDVAVGRGGGLGTQRVVVGVWNGNDNNDDDDNDVVSVHLYSTVELHVLISN